jgi:hypothetical protein
VYFIALNPNTDWGCIELHYIELRQDAQAPILILISILAFARILGHSARQISRADQKRRIKNSYPELSHFFGENDPFPRPLD